MDGSDFETALARHRAGDREGAERGYRAVLAQGDHWSALNNLAGLLSETGRRDEARALFDRMTALRPEAVGAWESLGVHLMRSADPAGAERAWRRVLDLAPDHADAPHRLAATLIAQGRFAEGWPLWEARETRRDSAAHGLPFPEWRGEPLAGKRLLVWREQGFGDQIQLARFLPRLDARQIVYAGPEALRRLFGQLPLDYVAVGSGDVAAPACDHWVLPYSLPARLGVTLETLPTQPYLSGTPRAAAGRIGLMWQGNATPDPGRSLDAASAGRLLAAPGMVSLHPDDTGAGDFQDTADLIAGLDLVISVDTATAHLAGAMGKPTWLLLPAYREDFRWMTGHETTPWYPSMKLFRQAAPGDWTSVVDAVLGQLTGAPA